MFSALTLSLMDPANTQFTHTFCFFSPFSSGAVYLEGGLEEARQLFGRLLFNSEVPDKIYYSALIFLFLPLPFLLLCNCKDG